MTGLFITFEGGDGSGKSTQASLLADWLTASGHTVERSREPGGTELGLELREIVLHRRGHIAPRAEALIYAADRAHNIVTKVRPAIERGEIVIQDRYLDSSVAYQGAGRVLDPTEVRDISLWATEGFMPNLTILLDLDETIGRERLDEARTKYDTRGREERLPLPRTRRFHRACGGGTAPFPRAPGHRFDRVDRRGHSRSGDSAPGGAPERCSSASPCLPVGVCLLPHRITPAICLLRRSSARKLGAHRRRTENLQELCRVKPVLAARAGPVSRSA